MFIVAARIAGSAGGAYVFQLVHHSADTLRAG
jgi:hypothetical protein